jgi:DNA-binding transcriptional regulator YdaS (Cro superfamily)
MSNLIEKQQNAVEKAINIAGSQAALAKKCRVKQQSISKWLKKGSVPPARVEDVIQAVNGQLTPTELCPVIERLISLSCKTITTKP